MVEASSFRKKILIITVKGAANENKILFLLGPIFCRASHFELRPGSLVWKSLQFADQGV